MLITSAHSWLKGLGRSCGRLQPKRSSHLLPTRKTDIVQDPERAPDSGTITMQSSIIRGAVLSMEAHEP